MNNKIKTVESILDILGECSFKNKLEILANVFIYLGGEGLPSPSDLKKDTDDIVAIALEDKAENGENIYNALVMQGLTILIWLENLK